MVVGVDIGGTKVAAAAVEGVEVAHRVERPTETASAAALLDSVAELVREVARGAGGEPTVVGAGAPSQIDAATGTALTSVNVPFEGVPLRAELGKRLGVPVFVDNDATCAALGEAQLADGPARDLVMLTLGTGVGGGIVIGGRVFHGASGLGGELGHMVVDARAADEAPVGGFPRPGSLEWHCSGRGLEREATQAAGEHPDSELARICERRGRVSGRDAVAAARAGDAPARAVLERYGRWLGVGVATVVNAFEPQRVVLGGGISLAADLFLDAARAEAARWALPALWERTTLELARGGADAGLVGAGALAVQELQRSGHTAP